MLMLQKLAQRDPTLGPCALGWAAAPDRGACRRVRPGDATGYRLADEIGSRILVPLALEATYMVVDQEIPGG
jgi:hypothetical protein